MGILAHCLPVVVRPRLPGSTAATPEALSQVQVAVNDVARSVVGCRREDHVTIRDLLEATKYLLLNQQAVKATAMSAWSAYHSRDGTNSIRNLVGEAMFSGAELPTAWSSRSAQAGEVRVRTRGLDTHHARAQGMECVQGAAGLKDKGRGKSCGQTTCKGFTVVRLSRNGHPEDKVKVTGKAKDKVTGMTGVAWKVFPPPHLSF
jgi:hypothetical protein